MGGFAEKSAKLIIKNENCRRHILPPSKFYKTCPKIQTAPHFCTTYYADGDDVLQQSITNYFYHKIHIFVFLLQVVFAPIFLVFHLFAIHFSSKNLSQITQRVLGKSRPPAMHFHIGNLCCGIVL